MSNSSVLSFSIQTSNYYQGQGAYQPRLSTFCAETSLDIINIGFVNIFPDNELSGWPGTNFGNQCDGSVYYVNGQPTGLLKNCHQIVEDIPLCQAAGKKIFLSLGGAGPSTGQSIHSVESAVAFAEWLWGAFGPVDSAYVSDEVPRPFDDIVFDGFDFDIEFNTGFGTSSELSFPQLSN
jgi:chitinase